MHLTRNITEECVMARIMRDAKMHQKNFSLRQYESWEAAEKAGRKWIKELKETLPPSRMNEEDRMTSRNRSGVVGVFLAKTVRRKPAPEGRRRGKTYEYWKWIAKWPGCPIKGGVTWTINDETGDDDAFALAVLSREAKSADRDKIRAKLARIYGRKSHLAIMEQKMLLLR